MTPPARILLVEDDLAIGRALAHALRQEGYTVEALASGDGIEEALLAFLPDLVLLDWMLPGSRDGIALARLVRSRSDAAVMLLTARDEVDDRLRGFQAGADDYIPKPFAVAEVLARVAAVLRRRGRLPTVIEVGDLIVDEDSGTVRRAEHEIELTATELRLLGYLAASRGRILSKNQLLTQVWGYDTQAANLVEVHMSALRRKLEAHGPRLIHTVRGLGYRLSA